KPLKTRTIMQRTLPAKCLFLVAGRRGGGSGCQFYLAVCGRDMGYSLARTWVTGQILGGVALGVGGTEGGRSPTGVPPTPNATVGCLVTTSDLWPTPHEAPGESLSTRKRPRPRAPGPRRER